MPDLEISNLPSLAEAGVAATDPLAIADLSASETKKVTVKDLIEAGVALIDAASIPAAKVGTLGTDQVATGAIIDANVTNAKLQYSSISLGGVSISLGGTDATPAFNLADATGYPTSSLSGTITNAQLAGSIDNNKLSNSSVSIGGVSISLGGTDATPAFDLTDATGYPTSSLVGTITNAQLAGSIDVSKLVGSNVNFGGVTVALGGSDTTPAFNLADATGYPTSSLVGTITNAQLAGSIANDKLSNSSVTLGGVSVSLGASDATPAFDLTDATNYPASSLTGTITNAQLAGSIAVSKLVASSVSLGGVSITLGTTDATPAFDLQDATGYPTSSLVGTITNAQLAGSIAADKLVSGSITSTQLGANSVTDSQLANNAVDTGAVQDGAITNDKVETSTNSTTGLDGATKIRDASITPAKLNTSNLDRSLNVASGNLGINNTVTAATRSGITYNAQGLITGTVALAASDLPLATTSAVGGVSVGTGLSVTGAGALSLTNSVTGATVSGITFNNQGMITAATALVAGDLPVATTSAKGAVQITSGGGLTVDGSGNLTTSTSGVSAGTYQSVTVNNKGVITAGTALTAALIPDLAATKITSGSIDAARIGADSIDGSKLSNASTTIFQSIAQQGYPTAQFNGQLLFDTVSEDAFIWDGTAWQAITTLTKGSLVFGGTYNASTSKMVSTTTAGIAAGLVVGSNLPSPTSTTDGVYVVVDTAGTPASPAPIVSLSPPDYILGVTNSSGSSWNEIDLSQTVAGQVASNITFTPYGQLSSTNVQDALQELETEKLALAGGTVTGQILIGNTGSLVFEGSTVDAYETTITVADPTTSDKTITFPDTTGTVITTGDTGTVTGTMIANDTIQNTDIKSDAAIAFSKLASVASGYLLVGNGASPSVAAAVAVTGDISINNAGLTSIAAGVIVDADISGSAAITGSKIATGTTSAVGVLQLTDSATSTSATTAATPAAVKIAKDAADAAATTANAALPKAGGVLTGHLTLDDEKELRFREEDAGGDHYIALKAAAALAADVTLTLPAVAPTAGQVLKADASTPTTLTWAADSATDSTKMPLAGGTFTGDVTFTGDSNDVVWDKSASAFTGTIAATAFSGPLTGNVTGNVSGSAATVTGATQSAITSLGTLAGFTSSSTGVVARFKREGTANGQYDFQLFNDAGNDCSLALIDSKASATRLTISSAGNATFAGELQVNNGKITVQGAQGNSAILQIFSDEGDDNEDKWRLLKSSGNNDLVIQNYGSGSWATNVTFDQNEGATFGNDISVSGGSINLGVADSSSGHINAYEAMTFNIDTDNDDTNRTFKFCTGGFDGSGSTLLTIAETGNVGIGTTSPSSKLDINCGTDNTGLQITSTDAGAFASYFDNTGASTIGHSGTNLVLSCDPAGSVSTSNIVFQVDSNNERMRIDSSGKVGIGTTSPNRTLSVKSNGGQFSIIDDDDSKLQMYCNAGVGSIFATGGTNIAGSFNIYTTPSGGSSTLALTVDSSQNATFAGNVTTGDELTVGANNDDVAKLQIRYSTVPAFITSSFDGTNGEATFSTNIARTSDGSGSWGSFTNGSYGASAVQLLSTTSGSSIKLLTGSSQGSNPTTALTLDSSQNATFAGTVSDSKGDLRNIPQNAQTSAYVITASDAGKHIRTDSNVTLNNSTLSVGDAVTIVNYGSSDITITQGSGVSLHLAGNGTGNQGDRTLVATGVCTILYVGSSQYFASGAGLS